MFKYLLTSMNMNITPLPAQYYNSNAINGNTTNESTRQVQPATSGIRVGLTAQTIQSIHARNHTNVRSSTETRTANTNLLQNSSSQHLRPLVPQQHTAFFQTQGKNKRNKQVQHQYRHQYNQHHPNTKNTKGGGGSSTSASTSSSLYHPLPTAAQISASIPSNASSIFHILDRRIDFDSLPQDTSFYALMRCWVQDDPYRRDMRRGVNFIERIMRRGFNFIGRIMRRGF